MKKSGRQARRSTLVRAALLTALALVAGAAPAHAHGQHELEVELFRGAKGPYELWVTAVPLVGFLEVAVTFEPDAPDAELGYSPRVVVSAAGDGVRLGPKTATRAFLVTANDYSATFDPGAEGQWEIVINIDSERGPETLTLPVTVVPGRGFPWTALVAGLGLVLPIVWLAWGAVRRKGRAKRRRT